MELVDLVDSKSSALGRVGSNPTCGTTDIFYIWAGVAQWLEFLPSKQAVEGSNPFARSTIILNKYNFSLNIYLWRQF